MSPYCYAQRPISAVPPGSVGGVCGAFLAALVALAGLGHTVLAQKARLVAGTVVNARTGESIEGATVVRVGTLHAYVTEADGRFVLGPAPAGAFVIEASAPGFRTVRIEVVADAELAIMLYADTDEVRAPEPALLRRLTTPSAPLSVGRASRRFAGAGEAGQRGVSVSPQVRGLWKDQVGILVNEVQYAPSPRSGVGLYPVAHGDRVDLVPGPYALTWGPGLLSAVRIGSAAPGTGRVTASYESETGSRNVSTVGAVRLGPALFALRAASLSDNGSQGSRYVPGSGRLRFVGPRLAISLLGGTELSIDAALASEGVRRTPNEEWRGHVSGSARHVRPERMLQELFMSASWQRVPGSLGWDRPGVPSRVLTTRVATLLAPGPKWSVELGTDLRSTSSLADDQDWTLVEYGLFSRSAIKGSRLAYDATLRLDVVHGSLASLPRTRGYLSAALMATTRLRDGWVASFGGGTATRTVGVQDSRRSQCGDGLLACEYYRAAAAELRTERIWQADFLVRSGDRPSGTGAGLFVRRLRGQRPLWLWIPGAAMDREVTVWGAEAWADWSMLGPVLGVSGSAAYLASYDHLVRGPAYGVPPASFAAGLQATAPGVPVRVGGDVHGAARRGNRTARQVEQRRIPAYITADIWVEADLPRRLRLRLAAVNLADELYRMEYDKDRAVGFPLRDPGRAWELSLSCEF